MSPIVCHIWCVRAKLKGGVKRYGSYPAGSLEKVRVLMGVHISDPVLHVCAGLVRLYPYGRAIGPNDKTLDLDESTDPDYLQDARESYPTGFKAIIADPDYSTEDAIKAKRPMGPSTLPTGGEILRRSLEALEPGRRAAILHVKGPTAPAGSLFVAKMNLSTGFNNVERAFYVYEKL